MSIPNSVVFAQSKGGAGKTSTCINIAGLLASGGHSVLVLDLDPQGDCSNTLGLEPTDGRELCDSLQHGDPAHIVSSGRPGLDIIRSARSLEQVKKILDSPEAWRDRVEALLAPVAGQYEVIFIDTPPQAPAIVQGVLSMAGSLVIPQDSDYGTVRATEDLARMFADARATNPSLLLLGVLLFGFGAGSKRIRQDLRESVYDLFGTPHTPGIARVDTDEPINPLEEPVFRAVIRASESAATYARREGALIQEIAEAHSATAAQWRDYINNPDAVRGLSSSNSTQLLEDYIDAAAELIARRAAWAGLQVSQQAEVA